MLLTDRRPRAGLAHASPAAGAFGPTRLPARNRSRRWWRLAGLAAALLAVAPASAAYADGDPASDVLALQDVYYPYQPKVSASVRIELDGLARAIRADGQTVKLALIASPADLGTQGKLFNHPAEYAHLLGVELQMAGSPDLTVAVMPVGVGVFDAADTSHLRVLRRSVQGLHPTSSRDADALAIAGGRAVVAVARASGSPPPAAAAAPFRGHAGSASASGGSGAVPLVGLALALVSGLVVSFRLRSRRSATVAVRSGIDGVA